MIEEILNKTLAKFVFPLQNFVLFVHKFTLLYCGLFAATTGNSTTIYKASGQLLKASDQFLDGHGLNRSS